MNTTEKVWILGHRGASFDAPENTAASFRLAKQYGADGSETDVHLTKDGVPVIHHNYTIDGTSDGSGTISRMTLEELRRLDFGFYKGKQYRGEKILTLEELLLLAKELNFKLINLELKPPVKKDPAFVCTIISVVEKTRMTDKVIFSSFEADLLRQVKEINSKYKVGLLTFATEEKGSFYGRADQVNDLIREMPSMFLAFYPIPNADEILDNMGRIFIDGTLTEQVDSLPFHVDYIHPDYHSILSNPEVVNEMHERGIGVNPWTCDDPEELQQLVSYGVDGIITNRPDVLVNVVSHAKVRD